MRPVTFGYSRISENWQVMTSVPLVRQVRRTLCSRPAPTWGRLHLLERIGEGAFGEVYRAFDPRLHREVALKVLRGGASGEQLHSRVIRESSNLAKIRHVNVVAVLGAKAGVRRAGFWMELVRGATLAQLLRSRGPLTAEETTCVGRQLCRALSAVHDAGVVHGDVKAQNVVLEDTGRVVLMDFGSSQCREQAQPPLHLTGTLAYLAPEVLNGGEPSVSADIYSLGVLLFHLVTAEYPVQASSIEELKQAHANRRVRRLADLHWGLPDAFVTGVEGALNHVDARFRTASELLAALAPVRAPLPHTVDPILTPTIEPSAEVALAETVSFSGACQTSTFIARSRSRRTAQTELSPRNSPSRSVYQVVRTGAHAKRRAGRCSVSLR